jgi:hypothetical protein
VAELADTVAILRSLASVCDLEVVDEVLDSAEGFDLLGMGESAFIGRAGEKLWTGIGRTVVARWDDVIDALDAVVTTPPVDPEALRQAQEEMVTMSRLTLADEAEAAGRNEDDEDENTGPRSPELEFWDEQGIDCISVTVDGRTGYSLRCYLNDEPVFLAEAGRIQLFLDKAELTQYIASADAEHALARIGTFGEIRDAAAAGQVSIEVAPENVYELDGMMQQLIHGPELVNKHQLKLAVELLTDAATFRGDEEPSTRSAPPLPWAG